MVRSSTFTSVIALLCFLISTLTPAYSQQTKVSGLVKDTDTEETLIGVQIRIKGTSEGVITDFDGNFEITTSHPRPFYLEFETIGYQKREVLVAKAAEFLEVNLVAFNSLTDGIVVAASRLAERTFEPAVSVQKMDIIDIKNNPGADFYTGLAFLKGVQMNTSSLAFQSVNTRSFADAQNWRFVQVIDGVDTNLPGFGFSMGNLSGASELDVRSIEVVPGAGSALYGPNAFNGFISIDTKNPFDYPGLSVYLKNGFTTQQDFGSNPYTDVGLRYAGQLGPKLGFKVNMTYLRATDWGANDESYIIANSDVPRKDELLSLPRDYPTYDAVHVYGDEVKALVDLGDSTLAPISRTGFKERDIIDYGINNIKLNAALHYRFNEKIEAIYDVKFSQNDAILRHTWFFPMVGLKHQLHRLEVKGSNFFVRSYYSKQHTNDAYSILKGSMFIQEQLRPTELWGADYGAAYRGEIPGIPAGDHYQARKFADRLVPHPSSPEFIQLMPLIFRNEEGIPGMATFSDLSSSFNVEGGYNFTHKVTGVHLQLGGNYRKYWLNSEGRLYNDGPSGFNRSIEVYEYGAYTQASKSILNNRLALRASLRYDKNRNFKGRLTPRASAVLTLDEERKHNIRASVQSAFRNAAPQEAYMAMDVDLYVIMGGTLHNIYNYNYSMGDGNQINGREILNDLVTPESFQAFAAAGASDTSLLVPVNINPLRPEKVTSVEVGYRGLFGESFTIDLNFYRNVYKDLASSTVAYNMATGRNFAFHTNTPEPITAYGVEAGLGLRLPGGFQLGVNYTYTDFDAEAAVQADPNFLPTFNSPNNRFNIIFGNPNIAKKGFGFNVKYRWSEGYTWQSPLGQGDIAAFGVMDAAISLKVPAIKSNLKLGASNLLNTPYRTIYGGPYAGGLYYMGIVFDSFVP